MSLAQHILLFHHYSLNKIYFQLWHPGLSIKYEIVLSLREASVRSWMPAKRNCSAFGTQLLPRKAQAGAETTHHNPQQNPAPWQGGSEQFIRCNRVRGANSRAPEPVVKWCKALPPKAAGELSEAMAVLPSTVWHTNLNF